MQNVSVQNTVTEVLPAGNRSGPASLFLQNQSDTNLRVALGSNIPALTTSLGVLLEPGDILVIDGAQMSQAISAISTGASGKTLHWSLN